MAYGKHIDRIVIQNGSEFDDQLRPGSIAPLSGVYRCETCRTSVVARNGESLPDDSHHRHADSAPIVWCLLVRSHWA